MHSDTPFHRHHWEMDFADVNTGGIRGFVDVVAAAVSFVACVFEAQPPFLRPLKHVSDTTCTSLYSTDWWGGVVVAPKEVRSDGDCGGGGRDGGGGQCSELLQERGELFRRAEGRSSGPRDATGSQLWSWCYFVHGCSSRDVMHYHIAPHVTIAKNLLLNPVHDAWLPSSCPTPVAYVHPPPAMLHPHQPSSGKRLWAA